VLGLFGAGFMASVEWQSKQSMLAAFYVSVAVSMPHVMSLNERPYRQSIHSRRLSLQYCASVFLAVRDDELLGQCIALTD